MLRESSERSASVRPRALQGDGGAPCGPPHQTVAFCPQEGWSAEARGLIFYTVWVKVSQNSVTWFLARVLVKLLNCADVSTELERISLSQRGSKQRQDGAQKGGAPSSSHSVNGIPLFSLSSSQHTWGTQLGCLPSKASTSCLFSIVVGSPPCLA